jgi:pantetheine-phosphate adenylyltransferase
MLPKQTRAAYLGSFRGLTNGHLDVIEKLSALFSEVIVGIGINPDKTPEFSLAELEDLTKHEVRRFPNVRVMAFRGLFMDFLEEQNVDVLVRGMRNTEDYAAQKTQDHYDTWNQARIKWENNGHGGRTRTTFYLPSPPDKEFISSSLVKALLQEQGEVNGLAPTRTIAELQARIERQYPYGVTGVSGAGKTETCRKFKALADELCIPLHHEDIDHIAHDILGKLQEPAYVALREEIGNVFGKKKVLMKDGTINRKKLGKILFADPQAMQTYNEMMRPHLLRQLRKNLNRRRGILLLDSALFADAGLTHLSNHNAMVVDADLKTRVRRLKIRAGLTPAQVKRRAESQYTTEKKLTSIQDAISKADYGSVQTLANTDDISDKALRSAFNTMLEQVDIFGELRISGFLARQGIADPQGGYKTIRLLYSDNDRRFHALSHIVDGLNVMQKIEDQIEDPKAFKLGWLFHDSVYDLAQSENDRPCCASNEQRSAELMAKHAKGWGFDDATIKKASNLILKTEYGLATPTTNDEKLFVDLDLSTLGRTPEFFQRYEENIRQEHSRIPDDAWKAGRTAFLESLDTNALYRTPYFQNEYGAQAKANIAASLEALKASPTRRKSPRKARSAHAPAA